MKKLVLLLILVFLGYGVWATGFMGPSILGELTGKWTLSDGRTLIVGVDTLSDGQGHRARYSYLNDWLKVKDVKIHVEWTDIDKLNLKTTDVERLYKVLSEANR
jgi:hypothetical protein